MDTKSEFLITQLEKPSEESKKWKMAVIGLKGIGGMFITGAIMFVFLPNMAGQVATLVQFGMTAFGGIVSVYLGAQGSVDFKTTAALEHITKDEKVEHITVTEKYDPDVEKRFADKFATDESYRPPATIPDRDAKIFR